MKWLWSVKMEPGNNCQVPFIVAAINMIDLVTLYFIIICLEQGHTLLEKSLKVLEFSF